MSSKNLPTLNSTLPIIKENWTGNPVANNQYTNLDGDSYRPLSDVLKWQTSAKPLKEFKKNQTSGIEVFTEGNFLTDASNGYTWLGHCTFYFTLNGINIITDPVLGKVSSVMPRHTELPVAQEALNNIDVILISHNHRDHLDKKSIKFLCALNPNSIIYTGLQTGKLLRRWKITNQIIEAGWWQNYPFVNDLQITYLPAKHWCRRALADTNDMLWGSFMLNANNKNYYFGADSGYGIHFSEIGAHYKNIEQAFIGIGAYMPEWFMSTSHTGPQDAIKVAADLNCKKITPMHFGTFDLADEPIFWPKQELKKIEHNCTAHIEFADIGKKYAL
jgi:L-ascorbate metabolism protein UlaG (beta-lactamase superfamily)